MQGNIHHPTRCPVCDAPPCVHGGHGGPIRRYGWVSYECGRAWHPDRGWGTYEEYCLSRRYEAALRAVIKAPAAKRIRTARAALGWTLALPPREGA